MFIIYTKNEFQHWTESIDKSNPGFIVFDTITKKGKKIHHELAYDQVAEIQEQDGTVDENRSKKAEDESI